jgi:hypothetical protein
MLEYSRGTNLRHASKINQVVVLVFGIECNVKRWLQQGKQLDIIERIYNEHVTYKNI